MNATREDIVACFRLLLGREPHTEELAGHYLLAGSPLDAVVSSYLQSLEFQHRGLLARNSEAELVTLERFQIYVAADDQLIAPNIRAGYEPETTQCFVELVRPDSCVVDIGANCGYFSLLACSLGATVYAFEPLQRNLRLLSASRALNRYANLHIIAAAASDTPSTLVIGASYTNGIVGPAPESPEAALSADYVAAVRVDDCLPPDMPVDLIKIDVEGHEFRALSGARRTIERYHPVILTEFSLAGLEANSRVSGRDYLEQIQSWGYSISVIGTPEVDTIEAILTCSAGVDHIDLIAVKTNLSHQTSVVLPDTAPPSVPG
jgi:FkbM family methyltransferase